MNNSVKLSCALLLAGTSALCAAQALQTEPLAVLPVPSENGVQVLYEQQHLTGGFGDWHSLSARGTYRVTPSDLLLGEATATHRYGVNGAFASVGDTHIFDPDWFGSLSAGAGDGAFYLPRYRVDASLSRKFLASRQLVGTVGGGYYRAPDGHVDRTLLLGAAYYFEAPWVAEGGVRFNRSSPGSVDTTQQYLAVTAGRAKADLVSVRHTWGGEGYLATAANSQLVNFRSRESTLSWQHWVTPQAGVIVAAVHYRNPLYRRTGLNVGVFFDF